MRSVLGLILISIGIVAAFIGFLVAIVALTMNGGGALPLWMFLAGFIGIGCIIAGAMIRRGAKLVDTPSQLGNGRAGRYLIDVAEKRYLDGSAYEVLYQKPVPGRNGRPSSLLVKVPVPAPTTLQFNQETGFDRFAKGIGLAREHQTGDDEFDQAVFIRGPSFGFAELYLDDPAKRSAILGLLAAGFNEVRLTGSTVEAMWNKFDPLKNDTPELLENSARDLAALASEVPADDPDASAAQTD